MKNIVERFLLLLLVICMSNIQTYSQRKCGSEMNIEYIKKTDPQRYQRIMNLENLTNRIIRQYQYRGLHPNQEVIIPVVVHVVYNTQEQNISDEQVFSQIKVLNDDFRRENADTINTPQAFRDYAGKFNIKFKLAKVAPNGEPTNGITRTFSVKTGFNYYVNDVKFSSMQGKDAWDTKKYLNIWVCNFTDNSLLGYAQFPSDLQTSPKTDGVVINYKAFGTIGNSLDPIFNKGRTTTHEVGHWLNLRHIWGDELNCTASDFVDDTPNQYQSSFGCPVFPKTDNCTHISPGIMFMNYMDYVNDACMNIFTKGQVNRMFTLFDVNTGIRRDILKDAIYLTTTLKADLYVRDSVGDIGDEPSRVSRMWVSPDIWIEDMDGNKVDPHGNDVYNVCVRVHNKSDYPSSGREVLLLNWTKGGLDLDWNGCWFGMKFFDCDGWKVPRGSYVNDARGTVIPIIQPHRSEVVRVKWLVPRREDYKGCDTTLDKELWHFCLLARIHDGHPIYLEDDSPANLAEMIVRNNNVALRNITVLESKHNRSIVSVGNPFKEFRSFSLLYTLFKNEKGELLNKYADVYLNMSSNLFELFEKSGFEGKGFKVVDKNKILLTEPTATIERLVLQPEELYLLEAEVNFFTQEKPENNEFMFDIAEYVDDEKGGKELIGGETYIAIRNSERDSYFKAKAVDDQTVLPAEPVSFRAEPISEDAVYTWFDQKGDTVARGLNLTVTPTSTQHYKLEVVATADGFKDYDSVQATVRNGAIVSLSPNPTDNQLTITYRLAAGITNATIEISDVQNLSVQSYPVTAAATAKTVSLASLTAGTYVVKLIINGETVDTRQVIKN